MPEREKSSLLQTLYRVATGGLFWVIVLFLAVYTLRSTCFIDGLERTLYVKDSAAANLLALLGVALLALGRRWRALRRLGDSLVSPRGFRLCRGALLLVILALSLYWVFSTQLIPVADQETVQQAARSFLAGDYSLLAPGEYLSRYPQQLGLVWFCVLLYRLLGSDSILIVQTLNALALTLFWWELSEVSGLLGFSRGVRLLVTLGGLLFYPLIFYCSFVYGNVMGLALSLAAVRQELLFFRRGGAGRAVLSALEIALAVLLKANYLIFLIGLVLYALVEISREKKARLLLYPLLVALLFLAQARLPLWAAEQVSGTELDSGASRWSWVAMGLQESDRAPGWYNAYNYVTYTDCGYDTAAQSRLSKDYIVSFARRCLRERRYAVAFFTQKTASQWINPTFQGYWVVRFRPSQIPIRPWAEAVLARQSAHRGALYLDKLEFIVLAGALLYCALCRRRRDYASSLLLAMIFVGGFVFHLFWEAKGQYTISYYVLLFPYAAAGYAALSRRLAGVRETGETPPSLRAVLRSPLLALTVAAAIVLGVCYGGGRMGYLSKDTLTYYHSVEIGEN